MNALARLNLLSTDMQLEPAEDALCPQVSRPSAPRRLQDVPEVSDAVLPNGRRIPLLKTLLTSACERNCYYCPFRAGRDFRRASLTPDEMARTFLSLVRGGIAQGLFLSSGVSGNSLRTQDHLIQTAEILRLKYHYRGYLHLKLMPGAERAQIERSMQLADRVSLNLEAPNTKRLEQLAPRKAFLEELLQPLRWVQEIRATQPPYLGWNGRWPSMTTQYVVGAVGESDLELLNTTAYLHQNLGLSRAYFSGFRPVSDTPFENLSPEVPYRQDHLYQASFLLRDYGFSLEDLPFDNGGNLPANTDPKTAWAQQHLAESPVEINQASREELLKVPGIGPKGAAAILAARRSGSINELEQLRKAGVNPSRAISFILLNGRRPARQLSLWTKP